MENKNKKKTIKEISFQLPSDLRNVAKWNYSSSYIDYILAL